VISSTDKTPTLDNHKWSDFSFKKERSLYLENVATSHLYVGIHGFTENTIISWKGTAGGRKEENMEIDQEEEDRTGKVQCKNCHAWVLERTLPLHEGFCLRNNVICPWGCGQVFKRGSEEFEQHWHCDQCEAIGDHKDEQEKHVAYNHTPKTCVCHQFTTNSYKALAEHRKTSCPEKLITCRYCHVSKGEFYKWRYRLLMQKLILHRS
jgi:hypothetical protein